MAKWDGQTKLRFKHGRYGSSKVKAFSVLSDNPPKQYLSARQLCLATGIDYFTLARALPKWVVWEYVKRYPTVNIGEGDYMYSILVKGRTWLRLAKEQLPNAPLFLKEMETWKHKVMVPARFEQFRALPFNQFTSRLHELVKANEHNIDQKYC